MLPRVKPSLDSIHDFIKAGLYNPGQGLLLHLPHLVHFCTWWSAVAIAVLENAPKRCMAAQVCNPQDLGAALNI
jgi:hypothetical protein